MKVAIILLNVAAVLGGAMIERNDGPPGCNSNNCARAVTGTRLGAASVTAHQNDCKSYQQVTTYYGENKVSKPTAIPAYASACTQNGDSYASACSCWGYPVVTHTVYPHYDDNGKDDGPHH